MGIKVQSKSNFGQLSKKLEKISEITEVSFNDLFNDKFLSACSSFTSLDDMFEKSGFKVESPEDFKNIPDKDWERFIVTNTKYESWLQMQQDAGAKYFQQQLTQGLKKL